jgi:TRAP-type uncharacterized transport system substrate-binding protein
MRNRVAPLAALVCAAFALGVVGCGGDDDSSTTTIAAGVSGATGVTGAPLTKEEFIKQADAICKTGNDTVDQAAEQVFGGQQPTPEQVEQVANDTVIPAIQQEHDDIAALTPPAGDEDEVQAILDALSSALDAVKADPQVLVASDNAGPFAEANQLAQDYGLKVCGQG